MPALKKPTELVKANGSWRICERENEISLPKKIPAHPSIIQSEESKEMYYRLGNELFAMGLMTANDGIELALLCNAYFQYNRYNKLLETEHELIYAGNGTLQAHPFCAMRNNAWMQLRKSCREFGMTPSARVGMTVSNNKKPDGAKDSDDEFFQTGS